MMQTDVWTVLTIFGLAVVTVITRSFFFLSSKPWTLPAWAQRGLHYAPIAALAGGAWFYWRGGVLGTILAGMAVYLPLHIGLNW